MSGGSSQQQAVSKSELDPELKAKFLENYARAGGVAQNLGARTFAGFTPTQEQAFATATDYATNMPAKPILQSAIGRTQALSNLTPADVSGGSFLQRNIQDYQNPYENEVVSRALGDIERQRQIAMTGESSRATAAKAFGGDRQAVAENLTNETYVRQQADKAAQLRSAGYTDAANRLEADIQRETQAKQYAANLGLTGSAQSAQMADALQNMGYKAADVLGQVGGVQQAFNQQQLDAIRNLPLEQQQIINQAFGINPAGGSGMTSTSTSSGTSKQGVLGYLFG
jgi:hypothetical protein